MVTFVCSARDCDMTEMGKVWFTCCEPCQGFLSHWRWSLDTGLVTSPILCRMVLPSRERGWDREMDLRVKQIASDFSVLIITCHFISLDVYKRQLLVVAIIND